MEFQKRVWVAQLFDSYQRLLPHSQRQSLYLFLIEDLSITEIASELATTRQAVLDAIKKGTNRLVAISEMIK